MHVCPRMLSLREKRARLNFWLLEKVNTWQFYIELGNLTFTPRKLDFELVFNKVD
jgi:hypothetical protein